MSKLKEFLQNWTEVRFHRNLPERRCYHSSFIYKDKLFIHGGSDIQEGTLDSLWCL
jgi:hypothetical protein